MAKRKTAAPKKSGRRENEHYREAKKDTNAHRRPAKRRK